MNLKIYFLALNVAAATALVSLPACSNTQAHNVDVIPTATLEIPYLKGRKAGLGSPDEITHVAGIYDAQKAILKQDPTQPKAYLALAELFMNEARITGEHPYYYPAAMKMLDAIPNLATQNEEVRYQTACYRASIYASLHEFSKALVEGEKARLIFPRESSIYGVLIDGNVELGNYEEAVRLSDVMVGMRPDLRSYSRVSYLREIHGDPAGAIEAMNLAVEAGVPGYEQSAWCRLTLAKLYETYGQLPEAKMHYTILLDERPNYPFAYAGLASIAAKEGRDKEAENLLDQAIALIPEVAFYEQKADLWLSQGKTAEAQQLVTEITAMMAEDAAAGHKMDLELAHVQLHLAGDVAAARASAAKALAERPHNIDVNAMMAEVAYAEGNLAEAKTFADVALRTGSQDPAKLLVAGLIAVDSGDRAAGKKLVKQAFEQDPYLDHPLAAKGKAQL